MPLNFLTLIGGKGLKLLVTNPNQERLAKKDIGGITAGLLQLENVTLKLIHNPQYICCRRLNTFVQTLTLKCFKIRTAIINVGIF